MDEALALLEKYGQRKCNKCPEELRALLKDLSDIYQKTGRKLSRSQLELEIRERGHKVGRATLHQWITDAGGVPWFAP